MRNSFSQMFPIDSTTEKKFYFVPFQATNAPLRYQVHINRDAELKKFSMENVSGAWEIQTQETKLPKWLFGLQDQFDKKIKEKIASQKK